MSVRRSEDEEDQNVEAQHELAGPTGDAEAIRTVPARDLLGGRGILRIQHGGEVYTLRLTRNNRLILTK